VSKGWISILNPPPEPVLQIDQHIRVSILLNQEAGRRVSYKDRTQPFAKTPSFQQCVHLAGDFDQAPT